MGFPPASWSYRVWPWVHAMARRLDQLLQGPNPPTLEEILRWWRHLATLLPCEICRAHFAEMLTADFLPPPPVPATTVVKPAVMPVLGSGEAFSWFGYSVDARQRIARRIGRPTRDAAFCLESSRWEERPTEWFNNAWSALQIISFAAPVITDAAWQAETEAFFHLLVRLFPNADTAVWHYILTDQSHILRTPPPPPTSAAPTDPATVAVVVGAGGVVEGVPWCATRERFMLTVHRLRSEAQKSPKFQVPALVTIVQQWVTELNAVVARFHAMIKEQQLARAAAAAAAAASSAQAPAAPATIPATPAAVAPQAAMGPEYPNSADYHEIPPMPEPDTKLPESAAAQALPTIPAMEGPAGGVAGSGVPVGIGGGGGGVEGGGLPAVAVLGVGGGRGAGAGAGERLRAAAAARQSRLASASVAAQAKPRRANCARCPSPPPPCPPSPKTPCPPKPHCPPSSSSSSSSPCPCPRPCSSSSSSSSCPCPRPCSSSSSPDCCSKGSDGCDNKGALFWCIVALSIVIVLLLLYGMWCYATGTPTTVLAVAPAITEAPTVLAMATTTVPVVPAVVPDPMVISAPVLEGDTVVSGPAVPRTSAMTVVVSRGPPPTVAPVESQRSLWSVPESLRPFYISPLVTNYVDVDHADQELPSEASRGDLPPTIIDPAIPPAEPAPIYVNDEPLFDTTDDPDS